MTAHEPSILVIDDESGILQTLKILLKNNGFHVEVAQGGKAGLEAIDSTTPDIVLEPVHIATQLPGVTNKTRTFDLLAPPDASLRLTLPSLPDLPLNFLSLRRHARAR